VGSWWNGGRRKDGGVIGARRESNGGSFEQRQNKGGKKRRARDEGEQTENQTGWVRRYMREQNSELERRDQRVKGMCWKQ